MIERAGDLPALFFLRGWLKMRVPDRIPAIVA
jgi:hypothetical protein